MLAQMVQQLRAMGVAPEDIPDAIRKIGEAAAQKRASLLAQGFPQTYVSSLTGDDLMSAGGLPLLTGQNEVDRELQARQVAEAGLGNRAGSASDYLRFKMQQDTDMRDRARDPFQLAQHLVDVSRLGRGEAGNPIQALIGQGKFIDPVMPSYLDDPRFQRVEQSLADYAAPKTFQSEQREDPNIARVREMRSTLGDTATNDIMRRFAEFDAMADGGELTTDEPMVGMGVMSGRPRFMVGEEGAEKLEVTPLKKRGRFGPQEGMPEGPHMMPDGMMMMAHGGTVRVKSGLSGVGAALRKRFAGLGASNARASQGRANAAALRGVDPNTRLDNAAGITIGGVRYTGSAGMGTAGQQAEMYQRNADRLAAGNQRFAAGYDRWQRGASRSRRAAAPGRRFGGASPTAPTAPTSGPLAGEGVSEREAAALALATALENNPFAPPELIADLRARGPARPGNVTQSFLKNVSPTLRDALLGLAPNFGFRMEDYAADIDRYRVPGASLYG